MGRAADVLRAAGWLTVSAAILLGARAPAVAGAAPGSEIVNIASCNYASPVVPPEPVPDSRPPVFVYSNPVRTAVAAPGCLATLTLEADPEGTVAPGAALGWVVTVTNAGGFPVSNATIRLDLDPRIEPRAFTDVIAPRLDGNPTAVQASWDPAAHSLTWVVPLLEVEQGVVLRVASRAPADAPPDDLIEARAAATSPGCPNPLTATKVTPVFPPVLVVTKSADRSTAVPGDGIVYQITIRHDGNGPDLASAELTDSLPEGLRYVPGSTRVDGALAPDPTVSPDALVLHWDLGPLASGQSRALRVTAVVAPTARHGEALNTVVAAGTTRGGARIVSAPGSAAVRIEPGPFRQESQIVGRVFVDDDGDGLPGPGEPGVPGALVLLEDGRGAVTDVTGRWHIEGVRPGLHVLRVDPQALPPTIVPREAGAEWVGDRSTRFLETRAAGLAIADMPMGPPGVARCGIRSGEFNLDVPAPSLLGPDGQAGEAATAVLDQAASVMADLGLGGSPVEIACTGPAHDDEIERDLSERMRSLLAARAAPGGPPLRAARAKRGPEFLEQAVRTGPVTAAILSPADGARSPRPAVDVEVTYPSALHPDLRVGGRPVSESRIGTTSVLPSRGLTAARYVGVPLEPGRNELEFRALADGQDASAVEPVAITIERPGAAAALRLSVRGGRIIADGTTPPAVEVEALDAGGMRTAEAPIVTIAVEGGRPVSPDADPFRDGLQIRLEDGRAELRLAPPTMPGRVRLVAESDRLEAEESFPVVPAAAAWRVVGLAEGHLAGAAGVEGDGGIPPGIEPDVSDDGGRLSLFGRGSVGQSAQLTFSVDSARRRDPERLFDAWEPDRFFPVFGDASVRDEEAERQGPVFARIDTATGYAQWGDFATGFDRTELARYDRRLAGLSGEAQAGHFTMDAFAAPTDQTTVRDVFAPDGTSGPYLLSRAPVVLRSESVVIEVRDRYRTDVVVERRILHFPLDYDLDPSSGALLFRGPIQPFDADFRPLRVVVLYETRAPGPNPVTGGVRLRFRPSEKIDVGSSAIVEGRNGSDLGLFGLDLAWRPRPGTTLRAETARTDEGAGGANAFRVDLASRPTPALDWELTYNDLAAGFANPTFLGSPELGSRRAGGSIRWTGDPWRVRGQAYLQDDTRTGLERRVAEVEAERAIHGLAAVGGLTAVQTSGPEDDTSAALAEAGVRGRISEKWSGELIHRQNLGGETASGYPTRTTAGIGYELREGTRVQLRQEIESGTSSHDRTVLAVESRVSPHTTAVARTSLEEGTEGMALRSMTGVDTTLPLSPRSTAGFSASRVDTHQGDGRADFSTLGGSYEYRAGGSLVSARYEITLGDRETRHLLTGAASYRPREEWTLFGRERLYASGPSSGGSAVRAEGRYGVAWRPGAGPWQVLARLDHSIGSGTATTPGAVLPGGVLSEPSASVATATPISGTPGLGVSLDRSSPAVRRDSFSVAIASGGRLTARQRMAASLVIRWVAPDASVALPSTMTHLLSLHYTQELGRRWTIGASARHFSQNLSRVTSFGTGVEVGWLAIRNVWLTGGYNLAGFSDGGYGDAGRTERGPFVSVRLKFDEASIAQWNDLRLDRP